MGMTTDEAPHIAMLILNALGLNSFSVWFCWKVPQRSLCGVPYLRDTVVHQPSVLSDYAHIRLPLVHGFFYFIERQRDDDPIHPRFVWRPNE